MLLAPIFKKLDAFIPALSLLPCFTHTCLDIFVTSNIYASMSKVIPTPVCFFLLYYIYSKCMYFWVHCFTDFHWRQFSKSWTPSFLPYPCSLRLWHLSFCIVVSNNTKTDAINCTNPCVFLFIILYIYSKCMYFWVHYFYKFSLTPIFKKLDAFIPALSLLGTLLLLFCFVLCIQNKTAEVKRNVPTPVCFFLLYYIYSKCMYFWVHYFYKFSLTPIFKKLDAFIPALSLLAIKFVLLYLFYVVHIKK